MVRRKWPAWRTHALLKRRTGTPSASSGYTLSAAASEAACQIPAPDTLSVPLQPVLPRQPRCSLGLLLAP